MKSLIAAVVAGLLFTAPALAQSAPPSQNSAQAELAKMAATLKQLPGVNFSSTVNFTINGTSSPISYKYTANLEKPDYVFIRLTTSDQEEADIYADGSNVNVVDAGTHQYAATSVKTVDDTLQGIMETGAASFGQNQILFADLETSFAFPSAFLLGHYDVMGGISAGAHYSMVQSKVSGIPVVIVTESLSAGSNSGTMTYTINRLDNLPIAMTQTFMDSGQTTLSVHQKIFGLTAQRNQIASATFQFTPPQGASLVQTEEQQIDAAMLKPGNPAPEFSVTTPSGSSVHLSDYAGKVVVLDFWATWCGPCQMALPKTDAIAKAFSQQDVVFLPICSWDQPSSFATWLKSHKSFYMSFYFDPAAMDQANNVSSKSYGVLGLPTQYVIGKDGKIVAGFSGYDQSGDPNENSLRIAIKKAMAGS